MGIIIIITANCIVAHPDDCVIFAWPFIDRYKEFIWKIIYLTYTVESERGLEISTYWKNKNISTLFLGFEDNWECVKQGQLGFDGFLAESAILNNSTCDLLLTHHQDGEYGHPHHKFINSVVERISTPKVYFSSIDNMNFECKTDNPVDTSQLPIHSQVIQGFSDRNIGRYVITESAKEILKL